MLVVLGSRGELKYPESKVPDFLSCFSNVLLRNTSQGSSALGETGETDEENDVKGNFKSFQQKLNSTRNFVKFKFDDKLFRGRRRRNPRLQYMWCLLTLSCSCWFQHRWPVLQPHRRSSPCTPRTPWGPCTCPAASRPCYRRGSHLVISHSHYPDIYEHYPDNIILIYIIVLSLSWYKIVLVSKQLTPWLIVILGLR